MSRIRWSIVLGLIAAAAYVASAGAAQKDPLALVLERADVPGAKIAEVTRGPTAIEQGLLRSLGIRARAARYAYVEIPSAGPHDVTISGVVIAAESSTAARKTFAFLRRESLRRARAVPLRRFGDEQLATYATNAGGDLLVRRNTVVWALSVRAAGAEELTWAQSRPDLVKYAGRQQRRIGAG